MSSCLPAARGRRRAAVSRRASTDGTARAGAAALLAALCLLLGFPAGSQERAAEEPAASSQGAPAMPSGQEVAQPTVSVIDLQPFRRQTEIEIDDGAGRHGTARLIDLQPRMHTWFVLTLAWQGSDAPQSYHLENAQPQTQRLRLDAGAGGRLLVASEDTETACDLWSAQAADGLAAAKASSAPYAPLCGERLYLRDSVEGRRTTKEWAADLLRDHVWGGERITDLVRDTFFKDAWLASPPLTRDGGQERRFAGAPPRPRLGEGYDDQKIEPEDLGLAVPREDGGQLGVGHWYPVVDQAGIFLSAVTPRAISDEVLRGVAHPVHALDPVEAGALVYLVAFDLSQFELGYAVGTEHPRVGWSNHLAPGVRDDRLPGPDGIGTIAPLVRTGMLSPAMQGRAAATFVGGFKRAHGAMRWGALSRVNQGSHYGFLVNGVILSRLQPGLATALVLADGRVRLETWSEADAADLERVRFARQNGVPIVEDETSGHPEPGALVTNWGAGNWSGSKDKRLRTLRSGLCLLESQGRRYLAYGWFSTATPSAMARVFMGYGCRYAMLLDMNALEHTYLALYHRRDSKLLIEHLVQGMSVLDKASGDQYLPRFVSFPDNRDFFYLLRRPPS